MELDAIRTYFRGEGPPESTDECDLMLDTVAVHTRGCRTRRRAVTRRAGQTPSRHCRRASRSVPGGDAPWTLEGFEACLDAWIAIEHPVIDLSSVVTAWVISRFDDPYQGVRREPGFDNLWFGPVPSSGDGRATPSPARWIEERTRTVRCNIIATLSQPI